MNLAMILQIYQWLVSKDQSIEHNMSSPQMLWEDILWQKAGIQSFKIN